MRLESAGVCYRRRGFIRPKADDVFWAIQGLSLSLLRGETLGVIGRNGAGKSTLMRLLAGIIRPDSGSISADNIKATLLSLQVGFVDYLSGRENVILSGLLLGMSRQEIKGKMESIIEFSELDDFIDEPIQTYSSGMRARLGFSTALHVEPDVLLIDEVLGVGDADFQEKSKAAMREKMRSGTTVVLVSHSPNLIQAVCDRVVWIEKGRMRQVGDPDEIVAQYKEAVERARRQRLKI